MDRTLKPPKRASKQRITRNIKAWKLFSPDGSTNCRYCPHSRKDHFTSSGQPHFYHPATEEEIRKRSIKLYVHHLPEGGYVMLKRITVSNKAELITAFCKACAKDKDTNQVLCYQRSLAKGEIVGLRAAQEQKTTAQGTPNK